MKEPENCPYCGSKPEIRIHNDKLEDTKSIRYEEAVNAWNDMIEKIKEMAQNE